MVQVAITAVAIAVAWRLFAARTRGRLNA
jgi:hypothetical protein